MNIVKNNIHIVDIKIEYKKFAKYYDKFYKNKNYAKETEFLKNFINQDDKIIDIGCGTGLHASLLQQNASKLMD